MKTCSKCKIQKPITDFHTKDGGKYIRYICKKCHHSDGVTRSKQYKIDAINYKGGKCQICEYNHSAAALEFHHRDPNEKDFSFGSVNRSFNSIKKELDKCDLLCSNCHRETHEQINSFKVDNSKDNIVGITCANCQKTKPAEQFSFRKQTGKLHVWCKFCEQKYQQNNRKNIKQEIVDYKGGKCKYCEYSKCLSALELHHTDPEQKSFGIASDRKRLSKIKNEVDKCELICANCHKEKHSK